MGIISTKHQVDVTHNVTTLHRVKVYEFTVSDCEDPDIFAAEKLYDWEHSDSGKFVMEHSQTTPVWRRHIDVGTYGHMYVITAEFSEKKLSEFYLRWSPNGSR